MINWYNKPIDACANPKDYEELTFIECGGFNNMTKKEILKLKFYSNDLDREITIKDFFKELLKKLLEEQEMFDSKRPFGNSDWDCDLIVCLIKNNIVQGQLDEDDYIEKVDWKQADKIIQELIESL